MTDTLWSFTPLAGLAIAFLANVLRARRTEDMSCLGHVFVFGRSDDECRTRVEQDRDRGVRRRRGRGLDPLEITDQATRRSSLEAIDS